MNPRLLLPLFATGLLALSAVAEETSPAAIQRYLAIDNVCAWPSLTMLPSGEIIATIHAEPSHGLAEGEVECWSSADGAFWKKAGHPAPHEPQTIRMNHAAGLAKNGDLLVLCSGWTNVKQPERPKQDPFRDAVLRSWVCRSSDGGRTFKQGKEFPAPEPGWTEYIPFGPIIAGEDGALHVSCYAGEMKDPSTTYKTKGYRSWHFKSGDDGKTWQRGSVIGAKHNETAIFHLGGKRWLAAARETAMDIFRSEDDGATWQGPLRVTARNEINATIIRLADGRLLLSYGNRVAGQRGVLAKLSSDEGLSWSEPIRLVKLPDTDVGYPSSVQRKDGKIVTAWYAGRSESHDRYHMAVAIWEAPAKP